MHKKSFALLLTGVSFLVVIGFVMLMSTCVFSAHADSLDGYREAKKQGVWLLLGVGVCWGAASIDYRFWKRVSGYFYGGTVLLLVLCFVPGVGMEVNGEQRWIGWGPLQFQPSELAKIAVAVMVAHWFSRNPDSGKNLFKGFIIPLSIAGIAIALVLFEVDIGTTAVLTVSTLVVLFVAGVDWKFLTSLVGTGVAGFIGMLSYAPDRMERILAFIDPEKHKLGAGFQQWISLMAIGSGGMTGRGIGEGRLKMLYMPFAHTDFIFPMIGEEMGMIATIGVVLGFVFIVIAGFSIAFHAPDRFGLLLAVGLASYIGFQGFLNIGVTTSTLPNTGLPLPFVSYGGSSLVFSFLAIGILINVFRQGKSTEESGPDWTLRPRITPRV